MNRNLAWTLRLLTVAGLAVDAYIHFKLAGSQPPSSSGQLSQTFLFNAEGVASVVAALLVLAIGARWTYLVAVVVAGSALAAVLLSRYVNIPAIGPLPAMYEPSWYFDKALTTVAEAVALIAAAAGFLIGLRPRREVKAPAPRTVTA